ncbi:hypothetical protein [Bacillus sp. MRMR6]|uniref:hypothetical protein n=1 Tax=Bacillus sp. MRMR6 TaxID=1928617 RepID=UPI0009514115|nr:hypothetical protein [Bacillus sp. MRMR6]OLS36837.1 hypothetical protein BTR25_16720 [Bacillus sp. MRMR6]
MSVYVYQTFIIKQEKFQDAIDNLREIKKFRNENFNHHVEILTPISGEDHTYGMLSTYDGLAEMEIQSKRMFDDEEYLELIGPFFLENIVEGSMYTQMYRALSDKKNTDKKNEKKE